MKAVITTVGTSIFMNYMKEEVRDLLGDDYTPIDVEFEAIENESVAKYDNFEPYIKEIKKTIKTYWLFGIKKDDNEWVLDENAFNDNASAEIKSLLKIKEEVDEAIKVYLISTDTISSKLASEIIKGTLNNYNGILFDENIHVIKGLRVDNFEDFEQRGFPGLIEAIKDIMESNKKNEIIFNISGGYKAIVPLLTIIGQLYNIPLYYIYEDTNELIEIPQMPVDYDFSMIEDNFIAFESLQKTLEKNLPTPETFKNDLGTNNKEREYEFQELINKNLIKEDNGKIKLTIFGSLLFEKYKSLFESEEFHRQNLMAKLVELKLFEYYIDKHGYNSKVIQGKKLDNEKGYDIDVYIEDDNSIKAIEIKSGGNVPLWIDKNKKNKEDTIEYRLQKGSFKYILNNTEGKEITLKVILYSHKDIHPSVKRQIRDLHDKCPSETRNLEWYLLKLRGNYKSSFDWKVSDKNLEKINIG